LFTRTPSTIDPKRMKIVAGRCPWSRPTSRRGWLLVLLAQPVYLYVSVSTIVDARAEQDIPEILWSWCALQGEPGDGRQLKAWGFTDVPDKYLQMGAAAK
jgi:hypothetical protein